MGFLKKLFGGQKQPDDHSADDQLVRFDGKGIFIYPECDKCKNRMQLRIDTERDLENEAPGYTWHKTMVCNNNRCFQRMETVVYFDRKYNVTETELENGRYLTVAEFGRLEAEAQAAKEAAARAAEEAEALALLQAEEDVSAESAPTPDTGPDSGGGERGFG